MSKVTAAERAALEAYARHGSVKAAAHALGKSPRTVRQQITAARDRLGADSPVQAAFRVLIPDIRD